MRDRLLDVLEPTRYRRFLVYVMGAYKAHDVAGGESFAFLEGVRDDLREVGFNAFLATDPEIPLSEMDAGTQTMAFARASNAMLFVVRHGGMNLGVGIEVGAVLEDMADDRRERILLLHESGMRSAMIGSVGTRWDAAVRTFDDREALLSEAKLFLADLVGKESTGELPFPPDE